MWFVLISTGGKTSAIDIQHCTSTAAYHDHCNASAADNYSPTTVDDDGSTANSSTAALNE